MNKLRIANYELRKVPILLLITSAMLLTACGGGPPAPPTAIPPSVARPDQPSPELVRAKPTFSEVNTSPTVIIVQDETTATPVVPESVGTPTPIQLLFQIPPSALGIATGGATVVDAPGGSILANVPAGSTLTVTGKSADGKFLAVYDDSGLSGWVSAGSMKLFGADDLTVVEEAISPAPIATMMAEAMQPPATSVLQAAMTEMMDTTPVENSTPTP